MLTWTPVSDSARVIAVAYDPDTETIYAKFPNDVEWFYANCPPIVWEEFTAQGTSKGRYIAEVLNHHHHGRHI